MSEYFHDQLLSIQRKYTFNNQLYSNSISYVWDADMNISYFELQLQTLKKAFPIFREKGSFYVFFDRSR